MHLSKFIKNKNSVILDILSNMVCMDILISDSVVKVNLIKNNQNILWVVETCSLQHLKRFKIISHEYIQYP